MFLSKILLNKINLPSLEDKLMLCADLLENLDFVFVYKLEHMKALSFQTQQIKYIN